VRSGKRTVLWSRVRRTRSAPVISTTTAERGLS